MKYLEKRFTVPMGSADYRKNFDKIDWKSKPTCQHPIKVWSDNWNWCCFTCDHSQHVSQGAIGCVSTSPDHSSPQQS